MSNRVNFRELALDLRRQLTEAQGVVQWPDADEIMQMAFEEGQPADDASGYCFELEEFDLFIERLMSEVARLNAAPVQQVRVPDGWRELAKAVTALDQVPRSSGHAMPKPEQVRAEAAVIRAARAMLTAYPAAPAADAGMVAVEWAKDAEEWGPALNKAGWLFLSELNEDPQKAC